MACRSREQLANDVFQRHGGLTESAGAVSTANFLNIASQFTYTNVMDSYEAEPAVFMDLIPEAPASTLDGEKIPGITEMGDEIGFRNESDPYPIAGFGEDWLFTPPIRDRGVIVALTWEAIFNDKTGLVARRGADIGKWFKHHREKRAVDCLIDENSTLHRYNWRGVTIASYGDNSGTHTWDNLAGSNTLTDWTDLDNAEQLFNAMVDPYTGEPIMIEAKHLIVTKQLEQTARRILTSTVINTGDITAAPGIQTVQDSPYKAKYELKTSRLLAARLATDSDWFLGDVSAYAKCMMAEKMNVLPAPPNHPDEYHRRIVQMNRVNERFAYVVVQPRAIVKST